MPVNLGTQAGRIREAAAQRRLMAMFEARLRKPIRRELKRVGGEAAARYLSGGAAAAERAAGAVHENNLRRILQPAYESMGHVFAMRVQGAQPKSMQRKDTADDLDRLIEEYARKVIAKNVQEISGTTRRLIAQVIGSSVQQEGATPREISLAIRQVMGTDSPEWRSTLIARTESHTASMQGSLLGAQGLSVTVNKVWVSVSDDRTREDHREIDGQERPLSGSFDVAGEALEFPGDPTADPAQICNCRCVMIYKETESTDEEEE